MTRKGPRVVGNDRDQVEHQCERHTSRNRTRGEDNRRDRGQHAQLDSAQQHRRHVAEVVHKPQQQVAERRCRGWNELLVDPTGHVEVELFRQRGRDDDDRGSPEEQRHVDVSPRRATYGPRQDHGEHE